MHFYMFVFFYLKIGCACTRKIIYIWFYECSMPMDDRIYYSNLIVDRTNALTSLTTQPTDQPALVPTIIPTEVSLNK